jgi:hypothetical protein
MEKYSEQMLFKGEARGNRTATWPLGFDSVPFGWIDGTVLPIPKPTDPIVQRLYYSGKHKMHCVNNVMVFVPDGTIVWYSLNHPGAQHDYTISRRLLDERLLGPSTPPLYGLLADVGFRSQYAERAFITVRKAGELPRRVGPKQSKVIDRWMFKHRIAVEWAFATLKNGFQRLRYPLPRDPFERKSILEVIVWLHNFRLRFGGVRNQLRTVYAPVIAQQARDRDLVVELGGGGHL